MSRTNQRQVNAPMRNSRNETTNVRAGSARSKSVSDARQRRRENNNNQMTHVEQPTLEDYEYYFENGQLVSTRDGKPFEFDFFKSKEDNQRRYHSIGRLVDTFVYNLLVDECHLKRVTIPINAKESEPTSFIFASDDLLTAEYLMIIIHGAGVVRAGQWSRSLIMNNGLKQGSQIDYIQQARALRYAVIVTNTNLNIDESSRSIYNAARAIRGSESPEEHGCYVWENFVRRSQARHICIMAHSYGGAVMVALASRFMVEFDKRVFAVALTDSPMNAYTKHCDRNVIKMLQKKTINWIADTNPADTDLKILRDYGRLRSAGHTLHGLTSYTAFQGIFKFFEDERRKLQRNEQ